MLIKRRGNRRDSKESSRDGSGSSKDDKESFREDRKSTSDNSDNNRDNGPREDDDSNEGTDKNQPSFMAPSVRSASSNPAVQEQPAVIAPVSPIKPPVATAPLSQDVTPITPSVNVVQPFINTNSNNIPAIPSNTEITTSSTPTSIPTQSSTSNEAILPSNTPVDSLEHSPTKTPIYNDSKPTATSNNYAQMSSNSSPKLNIIIPAVSAAILLLIVLCVFYFIRRKGSKLLSKDPKFTKSRTESTISSTILNKTESTIQEVYDEIPEDSELFDNLALPSMCTSKFTTLRKSKFDTVATQLAIEPSEANSYDTLSDYSLATTTKSQNTKSVYSLM